MKRFCRNLKDATRYALSDYKVIIIIGGFFALSSFINKFLSEWSFLYLTNLVMIFVIGYGSYIIVYTIESQNYLPKLDDFKGIIWEGIKKLGILVIYSIFITYMFAYAEVYYFQGNLLFSAIFIVLFALFWIIFIGGLINRYFNNGKFLSAFDIVKIVKLLFNFNLNNFTRLIIVVAISQIFAITVFIDIDQHTFCIFELFVSFFTFFLAPFLYIATKRLIGVYIKILLEK